MKKTERLHHMLRFINQKQYFTLTELMQEFHISKRTALRDIVSLEEMGAPIYVEYGRYGGYRLLQQMQLPPISFNTDELHALYFAMQALRSFTSLPFRTTFESVHKKFMAALSDQQRENIHLMQQRVTFKHTEQIKDSTHLELLLKAAVQKMVIQIEYPEKIRSATERNKVTVSFENKEPTKENLEVTPDPSEAVSKTKTSTRVIQPIALYASKGYWYCQAYDLEKKVYRVFRCDRIISAVLKDTEPVIELTDLRAEQYHSLWEPSEQAIPFQCQINEAGIEQFRQNHYPSMRLENKEGVCLLVGTYEPHELDFIVSYLAGYGTSIKIVEPEMLKKSLRQYYLSLLESI